jgi:hypothetical protein
MQERFPYEQSTWSGGDPERSRRWYEALERSGPENVRARLAQTDAGSAGSIAIGTEQSLTIGFAQEWLAWHDRQKAEREGQIPAQTNILDSVGRDSRERGSARCGDRMGTDNLGKMVGARRDTGRGVLHLPAISRSFGSSSSVSKFRKTSHGEQHRAMEAIFSRCPIATDHYC